MPARRVSAAQIRAAIEKWDHNVAAAAREVGIAPNNLRARLRALGWQRPSAGPATDDRASAPFLARPRHYSPVRLRPAHEELLREARLEVIARFRIDTDESTILGQFVEEAFEGWLRQKLAGEE